MENFLDLGIGQNKRQKFRKMGLGCGRKMGLRCGEEVKERVFLKFQTTFFFNFFFGKEPINVAIDMEVGDNNLGTKKGVSTECTKPILFSTLTTDYQISYSWDLKTLLFANGPPKTQDS